MWRLRARQGLYSKSLYCALHREGLVRSMPHLPTSQASVLKLRFPPPFKLAGSQWTNLSVRGCPLSICITSVFDLRYSADREMALAMAAEHGLSEELLNQSVDDEISVRSFENTGRAADTITFAVF